MKADAIESVKIDAANKAYTAKCEAIHAEIAAAIAAKTPFTDAVAKYELTLTTTDLFSLMLPLEGPNSREIMGSTLQFQAGTLSDLFTASSNFMIAYVADQEIAAEDAAFELARPQITASLLAQNESMLVRAWQKELLIKAEFTDLSQK